MSTCAAQLKQWLQSSDVAEIITADSDTGLSLNVSKCEIIAHKDFQVDDALLQSFHRSASVSRCSKLTLRGMVGVRNSPEPLTDWAPLVLRTPWFCWGRRSALQKFSILRCCPSADHPSLGKFDGLLRHSVQQITNSNLSETQWIETILKIQKNTSMKLFWNTK